MTETFLLGQLIKISEFLFDSADYLFLSIHTWTGGVLREIHHCLKHVTERGPKLANEDPGKDANAMLISWTILLTLCSTCILIMWFCIRTLASKSCSVRTVGGENKWKGCETGGNQLDHSGNSPGKGAGRLITWFLLAAGLISLPWEFIRTYQAEVAKKASLTLQVSLTVALNVSNCLISLCNMKKFI